MMDKQEAPDMVERVARAIAQANGMNPNNWRHYALRLEKQRKPTRPNPHGLRLVS